MTTANICIMIAIVAYLCVMLGVGWVCSKKNKSTDDFYLGGRKLGPLMTAMSAEASDMSGWLLMGLPGVAYLYGIADAGWTAIGLALGTYINWLIVAKRIRLYTHSIDAITIPDFFSKRFGDKKNILCGIAAVVIVIFFVPYTASGFAACGKLFSTIFAVDYMSAMVVSAIVIVGYCALGGFLAASTTDLIQSIVMTLALIMILVFGVSVAGGLDTVMANAKGLEGYLSMTAMHDPSTGGSSSYDLLTIISTMAWGLGYFGVPHVLLRFMAIEDANKLKQSRRIASIWVVISMGVAIFIGVVGYSVSAAGAIPVLADSENIIIVLSQLLAENGVFFALMGGLVLAGILASTMSTADSQLLTAASGISQNLLQDCFGMKMSKKTTMIVARVTVAVIAALGVAFASDPNSSVFGIVSFAWAGFGAAFGPVVLAALFWKRANLQGALAGMIVGGVMVVVWEYVLTPLGGIFTIYELLPAFLCALAAIVVVSLATKAPDKSLVEKFEEVQKML
ncbi:MAG: sodium/proline symporter [Eubacteriales bacterium]